MASKLLNGRWRARIMYKGELYYGKRGGYTTKGNAERAEAIIRLRVVDEPTQPVEIKASVTTKPMGIDEIKAAVKTTYPISVGKIGRPILKGYSVTKNKKSERWTVKILSNSGYQHLGTWGDEKTAEAAGKMGRKLYVGI